VLAESSTIEEEGELDYVTTPPTSDSDHATESLPFMTALENQIEKSKGHWSMLTNQLEYMEGDEVAEVSNVDSWRCSRHCRGILHGIVSSPHSMEMMMMSMI
jgi:hypothetical protein